MPRFLLRIEKLGYSSGEKIDAVSLLLLPDVLFYEIVCDRALINCLQIFQVKNSVAEFAVALCEF